jgi:hypothetical protein
MLTIEGQITEVLPVPIFGQYLGLFVTFRDGRIIKFQCPPTKFLQLNKNDVCVFRCTDDGLIRGVEIKKSKPKKPKKKNK